jgi:hypothetical protein
MLKISMTIRHVRFCHQLDEVEQNISLVMTLLNPTTDNTCRLYHVLIHIEGCCSRHRLGASEQNLLSLSCIEMRLPELHSLNPSPKCYACLIKCEKDTSEYEAWVAGFRDSPVRCYRRAKEQRIAFLIHAFSVKHTRI